MLWEPTERQWWVTGFNPSYFGNVDASKQVMICSVDFSQDMKKYSALKQEMNNHQNSEIRDYIIFDEANQMIWIFWYERSSV